MKNLKTIDLFAGIGGLRLAFEKYNCQNVSSLCIDYQEVKF
jgi:site-specific DNA-cytosine methylase